MRYLQIKYNISYMKRYIYIIFISLLICFLYTSCKKEGYINKPNKDKPDDLQFYACHDYNDINIGKQSYTTMGNNNYMLKYLLATQYVSGLVLPVISSFHPTVTPSIND